MAHWLGPSLRECKMNLGSKTWLFSNNFCLLKGGTAVDAVERAVRILEDDPTFDAGHGSVLTEDLTVEVDAMIMDGYSLESGTSILVCWLNRACHSP